jgi:hypothetical protein
MKDWHKLKPELFKKNPYYLTGCDSYQVVSYAHPLEIAQLVPISPLQKYPKIEVLFA